MVLNNKNIVIAYFSIAALSLFFLVSGKITGYYIFKPLIIPLMIFLLFRYMKDIIHEILPPLIIATVFSWLGDMLSLITVDEIFFKMCSICTFVVAQACYAYVFYLSTRKRIAKRKVTWYRRWPEALCIILFVLTISYVLPSLGFFIIPALLYAFVSSTAILFAINRRFYVSSLSFYRVMTGVAFFFMCDVLTGLDIYQSNPLLHSLVLLFYVLGHYFIINGMLIQVDREAENEKASESDALTKSYS